MSFDRRAFLATAAAAASASCGPLSAASKPALRPEDFGARGDGVTNDTRAFAALGAEVNRRGGGTIALGTGRTYLVGDDRPGHGRVAGIADPILALEGLSAPLTIIGNGARLRCKPGLRFGTFDAATKARVDRPMPNRNKAEVVSPYQAMIRIRNCRSTVTVRDIELDGNIERLVIGGKFGDTGWQIPAIGLYLLNNSGSEVIDKVYAHHHGQDGVTIKGIAEKAARSKITRLVCRSNGRQGVSIVGGRAYDFADCEFSRTGRTAIRSNPAAGVDIEGEGRLVRDVAFTRCKFIDNVGCGMAAAAGRSEDVKFADCLFVGATSWSAWPNKPGYVFTGCTFVGALVHAYGDADPARAARFVRCRFTDDPALSPSGAVYVRRRGAGPIAELVGDNVSFENSTFHLVGSAVLPATRPTVIYRDCRMSQRSQRSSRTRGRFLGTTTISGPVDLKGSTIEGTVIVNGRQIPRGRA